MRNIILFMHISLDGYTSGPGGELDWIKLDDNMFDFAADMTDKADSALYGRNTYELMESYWPTAGEKPDASKHDIEHSQWYNKVSKIILSGTLIESGMNNIKIFSDNIPGNINSIKNQEGGNILIFGSPTASNSLLRLGLIDDLWLFVNPVILGKGIPLFQNIAEKIDLKLKDTKTFDCGVIALHYVIK